MKIHAGAFLFLVSELLSSADAFSLVHNSPSLHRRLMHGSRFVINVDDSKGEETITMENSSSIEKEMDWERKDLFGTSIVQDTLNTMKLVDDTSHRLTIKEERIMRRRALHSLGLPSFDSYVKMAQGHKGSTNEITGVECSDTLQRKTPEILQLNIGLYCNQACGHCHVESSPLRTEQMTAAIASQCLQLLSNSPSIKTLDITGGAPEFNPSFRYLVRMARELRPDLEIIDRCNLTVLQEPGQEDLVDFLKEHRVTVVASLPCYSAENVNKQRGNGVFERSIAGLLALNKAGYGTDIPLHLVYNPLGAFLPPSQADLEVKYKQVLSENFGIVFNSLFALANMPIKRFADDLHRNGKMKDYMELLVNSFNPDTTQNLMCLNTVSVGYDGKVSFNRTNDMCGIFLPESSLSF
jgi:radical SAM/Cys-rich protein